MTRNLILTGLAAILVCFPAEAQDFSYREQTTRFSLGAAAGYYSGFGLELSGTFTDFARGLPLGARVTFGMASLDPGSAASARRIFINDATNGTPEKNGRVINLRFDGLIRLTDSSSTPIYLVAGPRYSSFRGNFRYVGGNEDFDVTTGQWGLGLGLEGSFAIGRSGALVIGGGTDYYFAGALEGHDTTYTPSGDDVNPRKRYTFEDADAAINQPRWVPRFMVGYSYVF
jgi:hypothetical protein